MLYMKSAQGLYAPLSLSVDRLALVLNSPSEPKQRAAPWLESRINRARMTSANSRHPCAGHAGVAALAQ